MQIVFFGTADLACPSLAALAACGLGRVAAVVTQPDRPKGRNLRPQPSTVKLEALRLGIPVLQPEKVRDTEFHETLRTLIPDLIVVAAYGQILPSAILELPRHGCLNVHASLLPKYRGAAPIQWALLNDESETGVTIMKMDAGLDTGDILKQRATPILDTDSSETLHDRLAVIGAELLLETLPDYLSGRIVPRKQAEIGPSYARRITKADGRLDWKLPARTLWNHVRAFRPWPGSFAFIPSAGQPVQIKIWEAQIGEQEGSRPGEVLAADRHGIAVACGKQSLRILSIQLEGGRRLTAQEFLAGHPLKPGLTLG